MRNVGITQCIREFGVRDDTGKIGELDEVYPQLLYDEFGPVGWDNI